MAARYGLVIQQSEATHLVVSLNGIPVHDVVMPRDKGRSTTTPPDHWLLPGENELAVHVISGVVGPSTLMDATVWDGKADQKLAVLRWPHDFDATGGKQHGASPLGVRTKSFDTPADHPRPIYMDAPPLRVPPEGTPETWAPIEAFHRAFATGDRDGVYDGLELRARDWFRHYRAPMSSPEALRALVDTRVTAPYRMLPLDRGATRFEPCAGGRMLRVRRLDGAPVIAGKPTAAGIPPCELATPLLLMHEGRYRIFY